jgi:hypothetical protein
LSAKLYKLNGFIYLNKSLEPHLWNTDGTIHLIYEIPCANNSLIVPFRATSKYLCPTPNLLLFDLAKVQNHHCIAIFASWQV